MNGVDNPERIRDMNIHRLGKLQDQVRQQAMPDVRNGEFDNLRIADNLSGFDKELHGMLSHNSNHNKSVGLISMGNNVLSGYKVKAKP